MPIYEFKCNTCGTKQSVVSSISEDVKAPDTCPEHDFDGCSGRMIRVYSFGLSFKGDGFYSTDKKVQIEYNPDA